MAAGAGDEDGHLGGHLVQIVAVGHPVHIGKVILIPAAAPQPCPVLAGMRRKEVPQGVLQISQTAGVLGQLGSAQRSAVVEQMHVAVVETSADEFSVQIGQGVALRCQRLCFGIGAGKDELSVFHRKGGDERLAAGVDIAVEINGFHGLCFLFSISRRP